MDNPPSLRVALCQIDTIVGALDHNTDLAIAALREAEATGCDVAIFPELTITGYPPEDLVLKPRFVADNVVALERLAAETSTTAVVLGYVEPGDGPTVGSGHPTLYNSAAVCAKGQVIGSYRKHELPNYGVFDEKRYFTPGTELPLWNIAGVTVGVTICEDLWIEGGPVDELAEAGAQFILNINASPYSQGKRAVREGIVRRRAAEGTVPIAYVNLVGGQDELIFDGGSMVIAADGSVVAQSSMFDEKVLIADFAVGDKRPTATEPITVTERSSASMVGLPPVIEPAPDPMAELWAALVLGTRDYVRNNGFTDICFGLSGGVDSTLVAAIAAEALGPEHVHALLMPSRYSSEHSVTDAEQLSINLGIDYRTIAIEPAHSAMLEMLASSFGDLEPNVTEENVQSRLRGVTWMAISNKFGWLVLVGGNKSEMAVGYATLYGDTAGAYAPIKDVWKLQVYELCHWYNERAGREIIPTHILTKAPSAELRPDQRDDQSLPPYEVLDPMLRDLIENDKTASDLIEAGGDEAIVKRIARLVDIAEFKRRQSPPGPRVTHKAFGRDRRMPITNRYRGGA
ncbi:MAG: NAD+ synthase [Acidimicrobiales bacterium]|nr:NAD+ synthase [Acidimicrobiales bacterium]